MQLDAAMKAVQLGACATNADVTAVYTVVLGLELYRGSATRGETSTGPA
jgi:hypothetical protein